MSALSRYPTVVAAALMLASCAGPTPGPDVVSQVTTQVSAQVGVTGQTQATAAPTEPAPLECGAPAHQISEVQGEEDRSPFVGLTATLEAVVVGDFQPGDGDAFDTDLGGFFVQEEDADADGDPRTSEGIFVAERREDVAVGQLVRVTGRISEVEGQTVLRSVRELVVCADGQELPTAATVRLPVVQPGYLEAFEGMRVTFPQELVISEYFNFDRFGEVVLAAPLPGATRVYQPTSYLDPRDPVIASAADHVRRSRITLDDGRDDENPHPARHPAGGEFTAVHTFRGGDVLVDLTGVLGYAFGGYRVQPTQNAEYVVRNPRPELPEDVGGFVRAGVFNVLNYFEDFGGTGCGPDANEECRGADDPREFERQRTKIVNAIVAMDAAAVGLIEIENDADQGAIMDLVSGLNAAAGSGTYAYVDAGGPVGVDVIRVAIVYKPGELQPIGSPAVLDSVAFLDPNRTGEDRNRAALAQTFEDRTGGRFTFVVNHLKSKGESCGRGDDDPVQGNCNVTRTLAVRELLDWLATSPTGSRDPDVLIVGDLNGYDREDPIVALAAGLDGVPGTGDDHVDLLRRYGGEDAYTYVFDGQLGYLDYAFASPTLAAQVTGATAWHINADEPDILDYDLTFKPAQQASLYRPDPFRSSDHDPVIVGLDLRTSMR